MIDNLSITASGLTDGVVVEQYLGTGAVTEDKIGDSAVTDNKYADDSIAQAKIKASAIGETQIAAASISSTKYQNNSIVSTKIADGAVTPAKLDRAYLPFADGASSFSMNQGLRFTDAKGNQYTLRTTGNTTTAALSLLKDNDISKKLINIDYVKSQVTIPNLLVSQAPTEDTQATNKKYVDDKIVPVNEFISDPVAKRILTPGTPGMVNVVIKNTSTKPTAGTTTTKDGTLFFKVTSPYEMWIVANNEWRQLI